MKRGLPILSSTVVGIIFGVLSNYSILLKGSWLNLPLWAMVGLLIGAFIEDRGLLRRSGISYGFFLTFAFLISGFQGSADKILGFTVFSFLVSIVGALCGWLFVFVGNWLKRRFM